MYCRQGMSLELCQALKDALWHCQEYGKAVTLVLNREADVSRDSYNSIRKYGTSLTISTYAFPVEFNPSDKQMEKAGILTKTDVQIYTPMKAWIDAGYTEESLSMIRGRVTIDGSAYEIRARGAASQFGGQFLYVTLGLTRA